MDAGPSGQAGDSNDKLLQPKAVAARRVMAFKVQRHSIFANNSSLALVLWPCSEQSDAGMKVERCNIRIHCSC